MKTTTRRKYWFFNLTALVVTMGVMLSRHGCSVPSAESEAPNYSSSFYPEIAMANGNLVFVAAGNGQSDVYRLDLATGKVIPLTETPSSKESDLAISRDGTQIAYVQWTNSTVTALVTSKVDGSERREIDVTKEARRNPSFLAEGDKRNPLFSEDGNILFYARSSRLPAEEYNRQDWDLYAFHRKDASTRQLTHLNSRSISNLKILNEDTLLFSYGYTPSSGTALDDLFASVNVKNKKVKFGEQVFGNDAFLSSEVDYLFPLHHQKFVKFVDKASSSEFTMEVTQQTATGSHLLFSENNIVATSVVEGTDSLLLCAQAPGSKENSGLFLFSLKDGKKTKIAGFDFFLNPSKVKLSPESLEALRRFQSDAK